MDPGQHDVGAHGADDVGFAGLDGDCGIAVAAVGLGSVGGGNVVADEAVETAGTKGLTASNAIRRRRSSNASGTSTGSPAAKPS